MSKESFSLNDLVTFFKGKKVSSYSLEGTVSIINISDIDDSGIQYHGLKSVDETSLNLERYRLKEGDVLLSSKGTVLKLAVFEEQKKPIIASANFTILRSKDERLTGFYLKSYLDSFEGQQALKSANIGKNSININTNLLKSIKIPLIPKVKQLYLEQTYLKGLRIYKQKLFRANQEWEKIQNEIRKNMF